MSNAGQPRSEHSIDPEGWQRAKELFSSLCEATPQERSGVLDAFPADDPIRLAAERLLRSLDSASGFLAEPPHRALDFPDAPGTLPARIGPYTPLERLGEGGFGIVYRARQTHPFEREVAVKLLRAGLESPQVLARFAEERHFLARLDHPDVVRVLDAGATEDGRLYVVMDLVVGRPITEFVRETLMPVEARLRLFARVCRAVHAVHQRGVIHRDLKPSNIVVSQKPDGPRPHIIDFGIAAALDTPERAGWTSIGTPMGTPRYASPEQTAATGDIDIRTDIYALGVILAEMLTAATPRSNATGHESPATPPSRLARDAGDRALASRVSGDLDRIVLKAVAWDRLLRYDSAAALADDVDRHLAGLPVLAAGPSAAYVARKFIARHRIATAAGALAALALTLGLLVSLAATRQATTQRLIAESNAKRVAFIGSFLLRTIERNADPDARSGDLVLDENALASLAEQAFAGLDDDPITMLDLLQTVGQIQYKVGLLGDAATTFERALTHERTLHAGPTERGIRLQLLLADTLNNEHADRPRSKALLEAALHEAQQLFPPDDPRLLSIRLRTTLPIEELERIIAILERDPAALPEDVLTGLQMVHFRLAFGPTPARSVPYAQRWYERARDHYGPAHSYTVSAMTAYASVLSIHASPQEALPLLEDALGHSLDTFGPDHHDTIITRRVLARVYGEADLPHMGIPHAIEHLRLTQQFDGEGSPQHAAAMRILGTLYAQAGQLELARETLTASLHAMRRHWSANHNMVTAIEVRLADVLARLGDLDAAEELAAHALASMTVESMALPIAMATRTMVTVLLAQDAPEAADRLIADTLARFEEAGISGRPVETLRRELHP